MNILTTFSCILGCTRLLRWIRAFAWHLIYEFSRYITHLNPIPLIKIWRWDFNVVSMSCHAWGFDAFFYFWRFLIFWTLVSRKLDRFTLASRRDLKRGFLICFGFLKLWGHFCLSVPHQVNEKCDVICCLRFYYFLIYFWLVY